MKFHDNYDLITFDDYNIPKHSVSFINQFVQGEEMEVNIKCKDYVTKTNNTPMIFTCNKPLKQLYPDNYTNIKPRFLELVIDEDFRSIFMSKEEIEEDDRINLEAEQDEQDEKDQQEEFLKD